jgi:AbrB family looped-hinge helix DNA binding protein
VIQLIPELHVIHDIMNQTLETTKVQDRGVVTLPRRVREKLGVKKGSTIAFVETEDGRIEVRALEADG